MNTNLSLFSWRQAKKGQLCKLRSEGCGEEVFVIWYITTPFIKTSMCSANRGKSFRLD